MFQLQSKNSPSIDQKKAIDTLSKNLNNHIHHQVLLGATGTGKTFTIANVINKVQKKTIILVHNKTLASQLYSEFKLLFPNNHVEYFISYFDYYTPEAYIPSSDTYVEKSSKVNKEIEMLRLSTINSMANYDDTIVIASVAAIFASSNPDDFNKWRLIIKKGEKISLKSLLVNLTKLQYERNNIELEPGVFRVNGDVIDIFPCYSDTFHYQILIDGDIVEEINIIDNLTNKKVKSILLCEIIPASEYVLGKDDYAVAFKNIENELRAQVKYFKEHNKLIEAQRLSERTNRDLESMRELGYCSGIENYCAQLELRSKGSMPYTIFDFFKKDDWLLVVDESHMTIPQINGMYNGDHSRKATLVDYGFRLPSALDNRPLKFDEFLGKVKDAIYVSATPQDWEIDKSNGVVVQQIIRPTGLVDPSIEIRSLDNQVNDLLGVLKKQIAKKQKTFITVLTQKMAEELSKLLIENKIKATYLHNELKTMQRNKVINDLRRGKYDAIVGINLLREGLDVPEVSLVCILDADKPGLFRNERALIQTFGRAARNVNGHVIMYANTITPAMKYAIDETNRRREIQIKYNKDNKITPKTIVKPIVDDLTSLEDVQLIEQYYNKPNADNSKIIKALTKEMLEAAKNQEYERAAHIRDMLIDVQNNNGKNK